MPTHAFRLCHTYDLRSVGVSTLLANGSWLVLGGSDGSADLTTSEALESALRFVPGPALPHEADGSCLVRLNSSHVFVTGNWPSDSRAFAMDVDSGEWSAMPDMARGRSLHGCGLVENEEEEEGGWEVVVAGGNDAGLSVEIFSLDRLEWRAGPDLPHPVTDGASVQVGR